MPSILFSCFHEYPVLSDVDMYDNDTIYRTDADINALRTMPFIAISLGSNCAPALYFNYYGLRVRSFPFDWNISSADALRAVIQNRCEGWLDLKDLVIKGDIIRNTRYDFCFMHDFNVRHWSNSANGLMPINQAALDEYASITERYRRRVERFYTVFTINVPIYLFRRSITSHEARRLYDLFKAMFPEANFTLVCIEDENWESARHWRNLPSGMRHFRLSRNTHPIDGNLNSEWRDVFVQLGLL
jgi:hypothetical protein